MSYSRVKGTLRGLHYQIWPFQETKLVRCTRGAVYDVLVDLRPDSPSFRKWKAVELTQVNYRYLYVPKGVAQGFQTLEHDTEVIYQISEVYSPEYSRGIRWDDPSFKIKWPSPGPLCLSYKDRNWKDWA